MDKLPLSAVRMTFLIQHHQRVQIRSPVRRTTQQMKFVSLHTTFTVRCQLLQLSKNAFLRTRNHSKVLDSTLQGEVMEAMEKPAAPSILHLGAVYNHWLQSWHRNRMRCRMCKELNGLHPLFLATVLGGDWADSPVNCAEIRTASPPAPQGRSRLASSGALASGPQLCLVRREACDGAQRIPSESTGRSPRGPPATREQYFRG